MRVQYVSDIHLEFFHIQKVLSVARNMEPVCEILVLAGDIGIPTHQNNHYRIFLETIAPKFKKIFIIAGNHEYYSSQSRTSVKKSIEDVCSKYDNITFLDNSAIDYDGHRWIGTTLWTKVDDPPRAIINDMNCICDFKPADYNREHEIARNFLETALKDSPLPCIIITHHLPLTELINPKYLVGDHAWDLNQWFAANLQQLAITHCDKIKGWFYGHTHAPSCQNHFGVKFLCNPIGYTGENRVKDYKCCVSV